MVTLAEMKKRNNLNKKQIEEPKIIHLKREMAIPFVFQKESLVGLDDKAAIVTDEEGVLYAGGWFVNPEEYPGCSVLMTLCEFKQRAIEDGDYLSVIVKGEFNDTYYTDSSVTG